MTHVRKDWEVEQSACPEHMRPFECSLPDDCSGCQRFVCNACEEVVSWHDGVADEASALCDICWARFIAPWAIEQRRLELKHALQLAQATTNRIEACVRVSQLCEGDRMKALELLRKWAE